MRSIQVCDFIAQWMGKVVEADRVLVREIDADDIVSWHPAPPSCESTCARDGVVVGWVSGVRWLREGKRYSASGYDDEYDPGGVSVHRTVPVALITPWPTVNPVRVPIGSIRDTCRTPSPPGTYLTDDYREMMREEMRAWPRDARGRWLPAETAPR